MAGGLPSRFGATCELSKKRPPSASLIAGTAQKLAHQLAEFPGACVVADRKATLEGLDLPAPMGHLNEFRHGKTIFDSGPSQAGASRFASGDGRHGSFSEGESQ